jgi:hypothetical protein
MCVIPTECVVPTNVCAVFGRDDSKTIIQAFQLIKSCQPFNGAKRQIRFVFGKDRPKIVWQDCPFSLTSFDSINDVSFGGPWLNATIVFDVVDLSMSKWAALACCASKIIFVLRPGESLKIAGQLVNVIESDVTPLPAEPLWKIKFVEGRPSDRAAVWDKLANSLGLGRSSISHAFQLGYLAGRASQMSTGVGAIAAGDDGKRRTFLTDISAIVKPNCGEGAQKALGEEALKSAEELPEAHLAGALWVLKRMNAIHELAKSGKLSFSFWEPMGPISWGLYSNGLLSFNSPLLYFADRLRGESPAPRISREELCAAIRADETCVAKDWEDDFARAEDQGSGDSVLRTLGRIRLMKIGPKLLDAASGLFACLENLKGFVAEFAELKEMSEVAGPKQRTKKSDTPVDKSREKNCSLIKNDLRSGREYLRTLATGADHLPGELGRNVVTALGKLEELRGFIDSGRVLILSETQVRSLNDFLRTLENFPETIRAEHLCPLTISKLALKPGMEGAFQRFARTGTAGKLEEILPFIYQGDIKAVEVKKGEPLNEILLAMNLPVGGELQEQRFPGKVVLMLGKDTAKRSFEEVCRVRSQSPLTVVGNQIVPTPLMVIDAKHSTCLVGTWPETTQVSVSGGEGKKSGVIEKEESESSGIGSAGGAKLKRDGDSAARVAGSGGHVGESGKVYGNTWGNGAVVRIGDGYHDKERPEPKFILLRADGFKPDGWPNPDDIAKMRRQIDALRLGSRHCDFDTFDEGRDAFDFDFFDGGPTAVWSSGCPPAVSV